MIAGRGRPAVRAAPHPSRRALARPAPLALALLALATAGACAPRPVAPSAGSPDAIAGAPPQASADSSGAARTRSASFEIRGARWWTGAGFEPRTAYVAGGRFVERPPQVIDTVLDLSGAWVVPPYGEAHTHTPAYVRERVREFERLGVFYVLLMNVHASTWARNSAWFDGPVEASATVAGFTAPNGHPVQIGMRRGATLEDLDGDWITAVATPEDVARKWGPTAALNDDFVKAFLLYSERWKERAADPSIPPRYRGMNPALLPDLVRRAHAGRLRVAVHVRTRADFAAAVRAGADIVAHLPGFSMGPSSLDELDDPDRRADAHHPEWFTLTREDAEAAASAGVTVVTTIGHLRREAPPELEDAARAFLERLADTRRDVLRRNLRALREAGVAVAIGSDAGEGNSIEEAEVVRKLGVYTDAEVVEMLVGAAPRLVFPHRRVGRLEPGYEAAFLALGASPLEDFGALRRVRLRFKGRPLP